MVNLDIVNRTIPFCIALTALSCAAQDYDLLLRGGHVIDAKNQVDAVRDVAIKDGKIAAVQTEDRSGQSR